MKLINPLAHSLEKLFEKLDDTQEIANIIENILERLLFGLLLEDYQHNDKDDQDDTNSILVHLANKNKPLLVKVLNAIEDDFLFEQILILIPDVGSNSLMDEIVKDDDLQTYVLNNLSLKRRPC